MIDINKLKSESEELTSGLGAVAWAALEMFKRGGMPAEELKQIHEKMNQYFAKPDNEVCNAVLRVVERRLEEDKNSKTHDWYE